jgi:hypothetical protein
MPDGHQHKRVVLNADRGEQEWCRRRLTTGDELDGGVGSGEGRCKCDGNRYACVLWSKGNC